MASGFWVGLFVFVMLGAEGLRYFKRKGTLDLIKEIHFFINQIRLKTKIIAKKTEIYFLYTLALILYKNDMTVRIISNTHNLTYTLNHLSYKTLFLILFFLYTSNNKKGNTNTEF